LKKEKKGVPSVKGITLDDDSLTQRGIPELTTPKPGSYFQTVLESIMKGRGQGAFSLGQEAWA